MQLDDMLEGYWLSKRRNMSTHSIADYSVTFRRLGEFLGSVEFEAITAADIERFLDYLDQGLGLAPKTVQNHWAALSSLWTWAELRLKLPHIIRGQVERPKCRRRQTAPYTEAEVRAILNACDYMLAYDRRTGRHVRGSRPTAVRDRAIIMVLVDAGLRVSELCDLRLRDFDKKRGQLVILHGKGDKKRMVYLGDVARAALWRYLAGRKEATPDDPLFVTFEGGRMDRSNVLHLIQRLGQRAGVDGAGPHRFRHTFAVNYLRNGGNLFGLQEMLGHEKLDTVRIYAKLAEADLEKIQRRASPADNWRL